jgi:ABC-type Fe3+-hydroxamate transport system substrate-binding protein
MKDEMKVLLEQLGELTKESARQTERIASVKAQINRIIKETPDPVTPWDPKGGMYTVTYNGWICHSAGDRPHHPRAGRTFPTRNAAEQASKFFTFYQRYYSLAMEMNAKHEATYSRYSIWFDSRHRLWCAGPHILSQDLTSLFTSQAGAKEAADIMNEDGWELPTL